MTLNWVKEWLENIFGFLPDWSGRYYSVALEGRQSEHLCSNVLRRQGGSITVLDNFPGATSGVFVIHRPVWSRSWRELYRMPGQHTLDIWKYQSVNESYSWENYWQFLLIVHGKNILGHSAKLHDYVLIIWIMNYLEILHRGLEKIKINNVHIC